MSIQKWLMSAPRIGDTHIYGYTAPLEKRPKPSDAAAARALSDSGEVMLYQRLCARDARGNGVYAYVAQVISPRAKRFIDCMSASVPTPKNPYLDCLALAGRRVA